jgi:hypothetical protein
MEEEPQTFGITIKGFATVAPAEPQEEPEEVEE